MGLWLIKILQSAIELPCLPPAKAGTFYNSVQVSPFPLVQCCIRNHSCLILQNTLGIQIKGSKTAITREVMIVNNKQKKILPALNTGAMHASSSTSQPSAMHSIMRTS